MFNIRSKLKSRFKFLYPLLAVFFIVLYLAGGWVIDQVALKPTPALASLSNQSYRMGQTRAFTLPAEVKGEERMMKARLVAVGRHTYIWLEAGRSLPRPVVSRLLKRFDEQTYRRNREYFADKSARAKVDRVNILITDLGDADGYFNPGDLVGGNLMNLIYIDIDVIKNKPSLASATLAHEFAHLIYRVSGGGDMEWLDEGLAVYAEHINGFYPRTYVESYKLIPEVRVADGEFLDSNESYGAAFLFVAFAAEQAEKSGASVPEFLQGLIRNSGSGLRGVDQVLRHYVNDPGYDSFSEVYRERQLAGFGERVGS